MSDIIDFLDFVFKCAVIIVCVKCIVDYLKNNSYTSQDFSYSDGRAIQHFRLCRDIAILCGKYDKTHSEELEKEIISKFHDMLVIDQESYTDVRRSIYFSTDMYCIAIQRMKETGLERKYEEVYNERS